MKARLTLLAVVLTCAIPASSPAAQSVYIRDYFSLNATASTPNGSSSTVYGWITRVRSIDPSASPGDLFPIVVDPNDPPTAPASAFTGTLQGWLSVQECTPGCYSSSVPASEVEFTTVDIPWFSNSIALSVEATLPTGAFSAVVQWARPQYSNFPSALGALSFNPWTSDDSAHVDVRLQQWLGGRNGYSTTGTISSPTLGESAVTGGGLTTSRYLDMTADADVN